MNNLKYIPKVLASLSNIALLIIALIPVLARPKVDLKTSTLFDLPNFYQHISNFSISYLLVAGIGFIWLLLGVDFKYIIRFSIAVLLSNFVYELWIPMLNTPDIIDAYYGFWGTSLAFVFLLLTKKYGLKANTTAGKKSCINKETDSVKDIT
jgi:hypothetical protein